MEILACILAIFVTQKLGCRRFVSYNLAVVALSCFTSTVVIRYGEGFSGELTFL